MPWQLAGQEVWVREVSERLEIGQGQKRVALHPLCRARHQVLTHPEYHRDIPLEDPGSGRRESAAPQGDRR